jgi:MFS transporter, UMF1 family
VGVVGALGFNVIARRVGNQNAVLSTLVIYCGVLLYGYAFVDSELEFYVMSGLIGAVMGGSQALSRSMYSLMIPKGHEAEYYAIYEISDRGTSWMGPLFFGLALQFTGNYRISILSLVVFFIAGFFILRGVDLKRAAEEAAR